MTWLRALRSSFPFAQLTEGYAFASFARQAERNGTLRLNLGCSPRLLAEWVNIDANIRPGVLTHASAGRLAPFYRRSAQYIYASHLLEHLAYPDSARAFVGECHRILDRGGALRLVVPGIEKIIRAYAADDQAFFAFSSRCIRTGARRSSST